MLVLARPTRFSLKFLLLAAAGTCVSLTSPVEAAGGGHGGGYGGGYIGGAPRGAFIGRSVRGARNGLIAPSRQTIGPAGMNRQLVIGDPRTESGFFPGRFYPGRSDPDPAYRQNVYRSGFKDQTGRPFYNRDRDGNLYGLGYGYGYGGFGGTYGYGGYAGSSREAYAYQGYAYQGGEGQSYAYAPPRIIEIGKGAGRGAGRNGLAKVTYGPSSASSATVGPGPLGAASGYAGGQDLFSPRIVRVP